MREEELFKPIKTLFEDMGFSVNAEVKNCDVTASNADGFIVIEIKRSLSVALLAQGIDRQRTGGDVYVAVPKPKNFTMQKYHDVLCVLKKLELGLILVTVGERFSYAEIALDPMPYNGVRIYSNRRKALLTEIAERKHDINVGGVNKRKVATAYTEKAVHIACLLEKHGMLTPKQLKEMGTDSVKTARILSSNFYGWFKKSDDGKYCLSDNWNDSLYTELIKYYRELVNNTNSQNGD